MFKLGKQKGQSIIEITLVTPILLIALMISADFGLAMFTAHLTQNSVREAARIGVTTRDSFSNTDANDIANLLLSSSSNIRLPSNLVSPTVTVKYYGTTADPPDCAASLEVGVQGTYKFFLYRLIALIGFDPPDPITISRVTTMRYEFQPDNSAGVSSSGNPVMCSTVMASN